MKCLRDIIREGLLDVEDNDKKGDAWMWFDILMNAKTKKEFNTHCRNLKKVLDKDLNTDGWNYEKVLAKLKRDTMKTKGLCIAFGEAFGESKSDQNWQIFVNEGYCKVMLYWNDIKNKVMVFPSSSRLYDQIVAIERKYHCYVYELNDEWNELRKAIIKETK